MGRRVGCGLASVGLSLLVVAPVGGIIYVDPGDAVMVERTPIIVFGEVRSIEAASGARHPSTDAIFEVEQVLKGNVPGGTILVRQLGGVSEDGVYSGIRGLPLMAPGDRMLLFLEEIPNTGGALVYRTVELSLGMFFEVPSAAGSLLVREAAFHEEVPASATRRVAWSGKRTTSRLCRPTGRLRWCRPIGCSPPLPVARRRTSLSGGGSSIGGAPSDSRSTLTDSPASRVVESPR